MHAFDCYVDGEALAEIADIERRETTTVRLLVDGVCVAEGCRPRTEYEAHDIEQRRVQRHVLDHLSCLSAEQRRRLCEIGEAATAALRERVQRQLQKPSGSVVIDVRGLLKRPVG